MHQIMIAFASMISDTLFPSVTSSYLFKVLNDSCHVILIELQDLDLVPVPLAGC